MSLLALLSPDARDELRELVRAEIAAALAGHDRDQATKRWLTAAEAGAYLGCSARAFRQRVYRGRVPAEALRRHGRSVLYDRLALDRMIEEEL